MRIDDKLEGTRTKSRGRGREMQSPVSAGSAAGGVLVGRCITSEEGVMRRLGCVSVTAVRGDGVWDVESGLWIWCVVVGDTERERRRAWVVFCVVLLREAASGLGRQARVVGVHREAVSAWRSFGGAGRVLLPRVSVGLWMLLVVGWSRREGRASGICVIAICMVERPVSARGTAERG